MQTKLKPNREGLVGVGVHFERIRRVTGQSKAALQLVQTERLSLSGLSAWVRNQTMLSEGSRDE